MGHPVSDLQSRTLNLGHTALVPAFLTSSVVLLWFSVELSNVEGEGKGRWWTQVPMSRIVACFLQGNVLMVVDVFLEKIIVFSKSQLGMNFQKCWLLETRNANLETRFSRPEIRVQSSFQS